MRAFACVRSPFTCTGSDAAKYPCFTSPEDLFLASESASKISVSNCTGYPANRRTKITVDYFGQRTTLCLPPIAPFAILGYFARIEYFHLKVPPELPLNRRDAMTKGIPGGPTRDDIDDFNARCATRVAGRHYGDTLDELLKSRRHDPDSRRSLPSFDLTSAHSSLIYYIPGTFSGCWQGSFIVS